MGMARAQATAVAVAVRRSVLRARGHRSGATGLPYANEYPSSPRASEATQRR